MGASEASAAHLDEHCLIPLQRALARLGQLSNPQAASQILRACLSGCKVLWQLRNSSPEVAGWLAAKCEKPLREILSTLVGSVIADKTWELATLPLAMGGLGLSRGAVLTAKRLGTVPSFNFDTPF